MIHRLRNLAKDKLRRKSWLAEMDSPRVVYGITVPASSLRFCTSAGPILGVREQIIAKLGEAFPGAHVSVDSARLRILGVSTERTAPDEV